MGRFRIYESGYLSKRRCSGQVTAICNQVDFTEFDAFDAGDMAGQFIQFFDFSFQDDNFQAMMMIQVDVGGYNRVYQVIMLKMRQLVYSRLL
jgi:hypothetical protein